MHLSHWATAQPRRPAVVMGRSGEVVTYRQLDEQSTRLARFLRELGLRRGDHFALLMENHRAFFEVVWAALRSGLHVTPVHRHLTADGVTYVLADSEAKVIVTSSALAEVTTAIDWATLPSVRARLMVGGTEPGFDDYDRALAACSPEPLPDERRAD